jgi:ABC-type sugar transport system substrate-binding protein
MDDSSKARHEAGAISRRGVLGAAGAAGLSVAVASLAGCSSGSGSAAAAAAGSTATKSGSVYYWISHGAPGDQIWVLALDGARKAGKDLGVTVRTSLLNNNVAAQEEAITRFTASSRNSGV